MQRANPRFTITRRLFLASGAAFLASPAKAHGVTVHVFGDSIAQGWALGDPRLISPKHPLYQFRSIMSMGNLLANENSMPINFVLPRLDWNSWGSVGFVDYLARFVRPGDWAILENAGTHIADHEAYGDRFVVAHDQLAAAGASVAFCTMFSYTNNAATTYHPEPNATVKQLAVEQGCILLDLKTAMDEWRQIARSQDNINVMDDAGVHPNPWGQMLILGVINRRLGFQRYVSTCHQISQIACDNYLRLKYEGTPAWSPDRARGYCQYLLL